MKYAFLILPLYAVYAEKKHKITGVPFYILCGLGFALGVAGLIFEIYLPEIIFGGET